MSKLALIELRGPFWTLHAVTPAFGLQNVNVDKPALQEDRILPIRTLLADAAVPEGDAQNWRRPRQMSMHLIAGAKGEYELNGEELAFEFHEKDTLTHGDFRTIDNRAEPKRAAFQHVTVEPILDKNGTWPKNNQAPPFRLIRGAIDLACDPDKLKFLGAMTESKHVFLRLTPDGIELHRKAPFPGRADMEGHFLLHQVGEKYRLRLLTEHRPESELKEWRDAWFSVTAKNDTISRTIVGLKVEGRRDPRPPAFVWSVEVPDGEILPLKASVEVPPEVLDVRMLSPRTVRGIDGEVTLTPDKYTLATRTLAPIPDNLPLGSEWNKTNTPVILLAEMTPTKDVNKKEQKISSRFRFDADDKKLGASLKNAQKENKPPAHRFSHDEARLAAALRRAYGFDELLPGVADADRPMISAFVPLDDGWLQLPVPNLPPPNVNKDDVILPAVPRIGNVLSGYLRFAQFGNPPPVLSAFNKEPFVVGETPWLITIEGAKGAVIAVGIKPADGGATLVRSAIALDDPQLSTRGFFWYSADRPDAFESLPRLGAGAGAFLDLPLETFDIERDSAVQFTLGAFEIEVENVKEKPQLVTRTNLELEVAFDSVTETEWQRVSRDGRAALEKARVVLKGKDVSGDPAPPLPPVRWQRHPVMPLAAEMPMTRSAAASVRPLESRDLVPFVIDVDDPKKNEPSRWVRFVSPRAAVFPQIRDLKLRTVAGWPWPQSTFDPEHGIALVAFGVPGAELSFNEKVKPDKEPWTRLEFALRYDIPALDEAFATATLPPQPPEKQLPEERELPPSPPVPLASDWQTMETFWGEQDRRHQVARVAHSYLVRQTKPGKADKIGNLIADLTWETDVDFKPGEQKQELPYGEAVIHKPLSGNDALLGADIPKLDINGNTLFENANGPLNFTGYAPASFRDKDKFLFDSRLSGAQQAVSKNGFLFRAINDRKAGDVTGLATLIDEVKAGECFTFWFKDLPITDDGTFKPPKHGEIDFNAWQDGNLVRSGFEWRLIPADGAQDVFIIGRDRVPFYGFTLEPLQLTSCVLTMSKGVPSGIKSVEIAARIRLGPVQRISAQDGNVVTLTFIPGTNGLKLSALKAPELEFVLHPKTGSKSRTRFTTALEWKNDALKFSQSELFVTMFGEERTFDNLTITASKDEGVKVEKKFSDAGTKPLVLPNEGKLIVHSVTLTVTKIKDVKLELTRTFNLLPKAVASSMKEKAPAAFRVHYRDDEATKVELLGITIDKDLEPGNDLDGAFTLTTKSAVAIKGSLFTGFDVKGTLSFGFLARIGLMEDGIADLTAGYFDGEIVTTTTGTVKLQRVTFHAERTQKSIWMGDLRFYGSIAVTNAITWPEIDTPMAADAEIPFPGNQTSGRRQVRIKPDLSYKHNVTYTLDGHGMPFEVAARIDDPKVVWTMPVVARHTITKSDGSITRSFTAVESIVIGTAAAIVPKPKLADDPLTFAPRKATTVVNGADTGKTEDGMIEDRIGRIGTVLRGALGLSFRRAFWPTDDTKHDGLFIAGGFVGALIAADKEDAPLLRLPVLAALATSTLSITQKGFGAPIHLAWTDSHAARNIIATARGAVAPASTADTAIRTALLEGSRAIAPAISPDAAIAAVLVEQSFAVPSGGDNLERSPFFIAAAVSLSRSLGQFADNKPAPTVLSLIAGYALDNRGEQRGLASAIVTRNLASNGAAAKRSPGDPTLATLGDDLAIHPWTGANVADLLESVPVAQIAGPAFADHVHPRAVLLRTEAVTNAIGQWRYDAPRLPKPFERPRNTTPVVEKDRAFADPGRGYALPPGDERERWLTAPEEIEMKPFRDADSDGVKSGLAGLSRVEALPAHASNISVLDGLVWIAQTRSPVYLPLGLSAVKSLPIPWLTPGTPRPRNPAGDAVVAAFDKIDVRPDKDDKLNVQPMLPPDATIASVGDRAGISLARITRLETALGKLAAFDGRNVRFGRPAQGGAWMARTERTPRPGILPKNLGKEDARDRRPCASLIIRDQSVLARKGPADRVSGEANKNIGAWSVTFIAARDWEGMITDSWDGTLPLLAEIDVDPANAPTDVLETLMRLLFPESSTKPQLLASASLVIGKVSVPFVRIHFRSATAFNNADGVKRGSVEIVLDARPSDPKQDPGAALRAIADALADDVLPPAEVQLVIHPDSREKPSSFTPPKVLDLTTSASSLAEGDARAPVTLRMPLAPVIRARGALPLAPASLLFVDPSYNAGLSSQPAEHRALLTKPAAAPPLPASRGALTCSLYADRNRINRKASVTFMVDLAFEKKLDALSRDVRTDADGDIIKGSTKGSFLLTLKVVPKDGDGRTVMLKDSLLAPPKIELAKVYALPLTSLAETSGAPVTLAAGDVLLLSIKETQDEKVTAKVVGDSTSVTSFIDITKLDETLVERSLTIVLTDEPVAEPPSALYAALVRRAPEDKDVHLSLLLYAQSPLPWRVDLREAKKDFRNGLMRRAAHFVWILSRPKTERDTTRVFIVKTDRNGQMFLPTKPEEFKNPT